MNKFLTTHRLYLTPLSPIHIGCGEDFEPTNYVIEDGVLYGFDPSSAALSDAERSKLAGIANRASLLGLQKFFRDHIRLFKPHAQVLIPVSKGVASQYENGIGRVANVETSGNQVFNRFTIERASYTGSHAWPYLPGSSFKGCLRTAWVDKLNDRRPPDRDEKRKPAALEHRLLQGDFATSPLRLLKVADFMPCCEPQREVLYAINRKKDRILKDGREIQPKGIAARKESVLHGQYRAFIAEVTLPSLAPHSNQKTTPALALPSLEKLARHANTYHLARWQEELKVLQSRGFVDTNWSNAVQKLLAGELGKKLEGGRAMLVRLGRYGGAESKTLTDVADIKIMQGKGQPPKYMSQTKTVWLAAENEDAQKNMLPFGWAIVEIDPEGDLPQLRQWCEEQAKGRPNMAQLRASFEAEKAEVARKVKEAADAAAAHAAQAAAEQAAAEERARALQDMSEHQRAIETLRDEWQKMAAQPNFTKHRTNPGSGPFSKARQLANAALEAANGWSAEEKAALAQMLEECLPQVIAPFGKDERGKKGVRLAALRGQ